MRIPLSSRLRACCDLIQTGDRVADIGCDHGYLGIYLLKNGIAATVIASDINQGPLQSAIRNSEKFGVRDRMTFCLSDGAQNIPRDFDTLVCAGMGADTIISILSRAPWLQNDQYRLVIQCQSKTPTLRRYLSENGWHIQQERVLQDGKFLYTVMEILWRPYHSLTPAECYFPPALIENEYLSAYYRWVVKGLENIVLNRKDHADPFQTEALQELRKKEHI